MNNGNENKSGWRPSGLPTSRERTPVAHAAALNETFLSVRLAPHRSLSHVGFVILMSIVAAVSFVAGLVFFLIGAWPVVGFLGLDVMLVFWALRLNTRAARGFEEIDVSRTHIMIRQVDARGNAREFWVNPLFARLIVERDGAAAVTRLALSDRTGHCTIGSFLNESERTIFAATLTQALATARAGG